MYLSLCAFDSHSDGMRAASGPLFLSLSFGDCSGLCVFDVCMFFFCATHIYNKTTIECLILSTQIELSSCEREKRYGNMAIRINGSGDDDGNGGSRQFTFRDEFKNICAL